MKNVDFQFDIYDPVTINATGKSGVITMCGVDDGGTKYFVQGDGDCQWWPERMLSPSTSLPAPPPGGPTHPAGE